MDTDTKSRLTLAYYIVSFLVLSIGLIGYIVTKESDSIHEPLRYTFIAGFAMVVLSMMINMS